MVQGVLGFDVLVQGRQVAPAQFVAQLAAVQLFEVVQPAVLPPATPLSAWPVSERRVSRVSFKDFDWSFFMVLSLENACGATVGPARSCILSPIVSRALSKSCPSSIVSNPACRGSPALACQIMSAILQDPALLTRLDYVQEEPSKGGVADCATRWMVATGVATAGRWHCHAEAAQAEERIQPWPMISFCHGGAYVATTDETRRLVDGTAILAVRGGQRYLTRGASRGAPFGTSLSIHPDLLTDILGDTARTDEHGFQGLVGPISPALRIQEAALFSSLAGLDGRGNLWFEEQVIALFATAVAQLGAKPLPGKSDAASKARDIVEAAKAVLADHFRGPISVADVAKRVGISSLYLCRLFRRIEASSLHQYVIWLRLNAAIEELADAGSLSDVAYSLGFAQHSHFSETFRRRFGRTPSAVRNELRRSGRTASELRGAGRPAQD
ncbi:MAG TPA: AraC family transcriptional regulator [Thermoanaerobaculia bacterium]|nr:AraC family transcriptional regulator [Thermoanaerobaculia bacterium]